MENFTYFNAPRIPFGRGRIAAIAERGAITPGIVEKQAA
jgi:hypothetical protein